MIDISKLTSSLEIRVREEPLGSVIIAALVGVFIALFFRLVFTAVVVGVGAYFISEFLKENKTEPSPQDKKTST